MRTAGDGGFDFLSEGNRFRGSRGKPADEALLGVVPENLGRPSDSEAFATERIVSGEGSSFAFGKADFPGVPESHRNRFLRPGRAQRKGASIDLLKVTADRCTSEPRDPGEFGRIGNCILAFWMKNELLDLFEGMTLAANAQIFFSFRERDFADLEAVSFAGNENPGTRKVDDLRLVAVPFLDRECNQLEFGVAIQDRKATSQSALSGAFYCHLVESRDFLSRRFADAKVAGLLVPEKPEVESMGLLGQFKDRDKPRLECHHEKVVPGLEHGAEISLLRQSNLEVGRAVWNLGAETDLDGFGKFDLPEEIARPLMGRESSFQVGEPFRGLAIATMGRPVGEVVGTRVAKIFAVDVQDFLDVLSPDLKRLGEGRAIEGDRLSGDFCQDSFESIPIGEMNPELRGVGFLGGSLRGRWEANPLQLLDSEPEGFGKRGCLPADLVSLAFEERTFQLVSVSPSQPGIIFFFGLERERA